MGQGINLWTAEFNECTPASMCSTWNTVIDQPDCHQSASILFLVAEEDVSTSFLALVYYKHFRVGLPGCRRIVPAPSCLRSAQTLSWLRFGRFVVCMDLLGRSAMAAKGTRWLRQLMAFLDREQFSPQEAEYIRCCWSRARGLKS